MKPRDTSWGGVADWYDDLLTKEKSNYQKDLVLPNLMRLMNIKPGERILDLACGQGFFSFEFAKAGGEVTGVDIAKELINIASLQATSYPASAGPRNGGGKLLTFRTAPADKIDFVPSGSIDKIAIVLAIQNIENLDGVFKECARVLRSGGRLFVVMNHPSFRIPKRSSWDWDPSTELRAGVKGTQYRRIDGYMSESREKIDMHPGKSLSASGGNKNYTVSFHRPLQVYFKSFAKNGLAVSRLEEWVSNRKSEPGPRAEAENTIRKEIPLFLALELFKIK